MENAMIIAIIIALIVIVLLILELKKSSNTVKILKEKANYWQYRSDAKEYLLLRATKSGLLPSVTFTFTDYGVGSILIYENQDIDNPKKISCIQGVDANIHEISPN